MPSIAPLGSGKLPECWCLSLCPVESFRGGEGQGGQGPRKLPRRPVGTGPISTLARGQAGRPGWRGRAGSRVGCGLARHAAGRRRGPSTMLAPRWRALPARRQRLGCGEGRGTGARTGAGCGPAPPPTSEGGGFVCLADFGTGVRGCLGFGLRPETGRGAGWRCEPQ